MFLGEGLFIGDIFVMGSVFLFMRDVVRIYCIFSFLNSFLAKFFKSLC